jgi:hypothetical protein
VITGEEDKFYKPSWSENPSDSNNQFPAGWRFAGMEIGLAAD